MNVPEGYLELGFFLLSGCTALLVLGILAMKISRNPALRQRVGEATVLATTLYLVLACIPLDLPSREWITSPVSPRETAIDVPPKIATSIPPTNVSPLENSHHSISPDDPPRNKIISHTIENKPDTKTRLVLQTQPESEAVAAQFGNQLPDKIEPDKIAEDPSRLSPENSSNTVEESQAVVWQWKRPLGVVYFLGTIVCIGWLSIGKISLHLLLSRTKQPPEEIKELLWSIASRHFARPPKIRISQNRSRAFSFGLFRPTIVVPESLCHQKNRQFLRTVLLHEVAHLVRRDALSRLLFNVAFPLLYFHPCYWWIRRDVYFSSELIADDCAANDSTPLKYAEELTSIKRFFTEKVPVIYGSNNFFSTRLDFTRRITMLIQRKSPLPNKISNVKKIVIYGFFSILLCGLAMTTGVRDVAAKDTASSTDDNPLGAQKTNPSTKLNNPFTTQKIGVTQNENSPFQKKRTKNKTTEDDPDKKKREPRNTQNPIGVTQTSSTRSTVTGRPVELVQLATQYADAIETIAKTSSELQKLVEINNKRKGMIPEYEIERQEIILKAAKQKRELFHTIAKAELDLTGVELELAIHEHERFEKMFIKGHIARIQVLKKKRELIRLEARSRVLEAILELK